MAKKRQPRESLPDEWFSRLVVFCERQWEERNKDGVKAPLDIYQFIGKSRRTIETAKRKRSMTKAAFAQITVAIGCETIEHLKAILAGTPLSDAKVAAPPEKKTAELPSEDNTSTVRKKMRRAQQLVRTGESKAALKLMEEALATARTAKHAEAIVECVVGIVLTSPRRSHPDNRRELVAEAERALTSVTDPTLKVLFLRAKARVCQDSRDIAGEEANLREALALCEAEADDKKRNLASQACILRSVLVHLLCHAKRLDEAKPLLADCENYARANPEDEDGELLRAALQAGIHLETVADNEEGAVARIAEFEAAAKSSRLADGIGSDLTNAANNLSHDGAHKAALAAAEAAIRLAGRVEGDRGKRFFVGALYNEAAVLARARANDELALRKAEALLALCNDPEDAIIKKATQQLIAELRRVGGDSQTAVNLARQVVATIEGEPEAVIFAKSSLARALNDNGQTEEALKEVCEAFEILKAAKAPARACAEILDQITNYASQLGATEVVEEGLKQLAALPDGHDEIKKAKSRAQARADANAKLRGRFLEMMKPNTMPEDVGRVQPPSLQEANAKELAPLLNLWDETRATPDLAAGLYDLWGRGTFARILHNTKAFPNAFNVTVEVRRCEDVKRAVRLWGMYADLLILLWKGPTKNYNMSLVPFPNALGDLGRAGGWGYYICGDIVKIKGSSKKWLNAMAFGVSYLPEDVTIFLTTEARPFLKSGRLIIVPAVGAGCVNPGHGPFEQMLAESANAVASIRCRGKAESLIGLIPYSPDAPFEVLAEISDSEAVRLRKLRLLLLRRTRELRPDIASEQKAKELSLEIDDALRDLIDRHKGHGRKSGFNSAQESLTGSVASFRQDGHRLSEPFVDSPFAPLFQLESLGYGWRVEGGEIPKLPPRFEPQEGDVVGAWLAPPTHGFGFFGMREASKG